MATESSPHPHQAGYERPRYEVADIFELYFDAYNAKHKVSPQQLKVVSAMRRCRTAALGAHVRECEECGYQEQAYNSCRDRHCPKCQYALKEKWVLARLEDLLPIPYFHLIFTLTNLLHNLMLLNKALTYDLFFKSAAETLQQFAQDPRHLGAQIGFIGILHTWGQTLVYHPHLHFIVTGGGLAEDGKRWVAPKYGDKFLFPDRALSKVMRGKFLKKLEQAYAAGQLRFEGQIAHLAQPAAFKQYLRELARTEFVVRSRPPFGAPEKVVGYLGRYTHRVAISNQRILDIAGGQVRFGYKDNRAGGKHKVMPLSAEEFIRRFLLHILPKGFKKIRHFGFLSGGVRKKKLALARRLLAAREKCAGLAVAVSARLQGLFNQCPQCKMGRMLFKGLVDAHALEKRLAFRAKTQLLLDGL